MAYANLAFTNVLAQCHYNPQLKNYMHQEFTHVLSMYPTMNARPVQININSSTYTILEVQGTIPVLYQNATYNIPIKLQYPIEYPNIAPVLIVNPSNDMVIKASEFVQTDGRSTLDIQRLWNTRCTTVQLLDEAKRAFSVKMPVFKKSKTQPNPQAYPNNPQPYSNANPAGQYPQNYAQNANYPSLSNANAYPQAYAQALNTFTQPNMPSRAQGNIPPPASINQGVDQKRLKEVYSKILKELNEEVKVLTEESEKINKNSEEITKTISGFKEEMDKGGIKKQLLTASIKNTQEWINSCSGGDCFDVSEEELIEYKNSIAKDYLSLYSQEKALDSTIQALTDALNKSIIPAKDALLELKQLLTDLFMVSRLKEKAEILAKQSS